MLRSLPFVTQSDGRLLKKRDTVNPARDGGKMSKKRELSAKSGKVGISAVINSKKTSISIYIHTNNLSKATLKTSEHYTACYKTMVTIISFN